LGIRDTVLRFYTWVRLAYTRIRDWNTKRVKDREEKTRIRREKELELLNQEAETLEAQLLTLRLQNEVSEERRRLQNMD